MDRDDLEEMGPIDYLVVEFPGSNMTGEGLPLLVDQEDLDHAGGVLEPGSSAGLLVYENRWAAPFAKALRRGGGQLVAHGRIPIQAVLAALDATEESVV